MWVFNGPMNLLEGGYATLDTLFLLAPWVFLVLIPAVTMRSFSEEKRIGTLDLLFTRPFPVFQIIITKYLAAFVLILLALVPTIIYYFSIRMLGNPIGNIDTGGTWGSYIGLLFLAGVYSAIGIFCSSLTDNLIISFLLAAFLCLFMCFGFEQIGNMMRIGKTGEFLLSLGIIEHYRSMSRGVIDTRDAVYFIAVIAIFLFLTKARLEIRTK
jgi:ABC-2 type transport system permease protein